jgi:hypothetical protein
MSRSSSITDNPPSFETLLRHLDSPSSSISSGITSRIAARRRHMAELEVLLNPKASPAQEIFVVPAPDRPRHVRALDKLRLWREWVAEKSRRFKHGSY